MLYLSFAVRLHRVLRATPEKVYRAFLDAGAMAKWLPPYGFTCAVHHMDPRVGGTFRMSFHNFSTGHGHAFGGEYLELAPNERIRYTDKFDDPNLPGQMEVEVSLKPVVSQCNCALSPAVQNSALLRKAFQRPFRLRCVTSAGRSRWRSSPHSSSRTSPVERSDA